MALFLCCWPPAKSQLCNLNAHFRGISGSVLILLVMSGAPLWSRSVTASWKPFLKSYLMRTKCHTADFSEKHRSIKRVNNDDVTDDDGFLRGWKTNDFNQWRHLLLLRIGDNILNCKDFYPRFLQKMNQNWILSLFFLMQGRANPSSPNTLPLLQLKGIMQGLLGCVVVWVPISTSRSNQTLRIKTKKKTFSL